MNRQMTNKRNESLTSSVREKFFPERTPGAKEFETPVLPVEVDDHDIDYEGGNSDDEGFHDQNKLLKMTSDDTQ